MTNTITPEELEAIEIDWTQGVSENFERVKAALLSALAAERDRADKAEALLKDANTPYTQREIGNLVFDGNSVSFWRDKAKAYGGAASALRARADKAEDRAERLQDALQELQQWANAYPLNIFPEPDFSLAAKVLTDAGLSLDAISASNMRHVLTRVEEITRAALNEKETGNNAR